MLRVKLVQSSFSALMLLVGWKEWCPADKNSFPVSFISVCLPVGSAPENFFNLKRHYTNLLHSFIHSLWAVWLRLIGLLACSTAKKTTDKLQRVLNAAARDVSNRGKYDRGSGIRLYTGLTSQTGSSSGCASKCTSVSTAWLPDIWPSSVNQSPTSMVTGTCDQLAVAS